MSTMFGGGAPGVSAEGYKLGYDAIGKNKAEEDRLTAKALEIEDMAAAAGVDAKTLGMLQENKRQATIANPNPFMTTGYGGVGGSARTLGASYLLGT